MNPVTIEKGFQEALGTCLFKLGPGSAPVNLPCKGTLRHVRGHNDIEYAGGEHLGGYWFWLPSTYIQGNNHLWAKEKLYRVVCMLQFNLPALSALTGGNSALHWWSAGRGSWHLPPCSSPCSLKTHTKDMNVTGQEMTPPLPSCTCIIWIIPMPSSYPIMQVT